MRTNILFVCSANIDRSPASEELVNNSKEWKYKYEARSAGTHPLAEKQISQHAIDWADKILVMEYEHRQSIIERFPEAEKKIIVLNIPNTLVRHDPMLKKALERELKKWL